jgi:hypothetical protein
MSVLECLVEAVPMQCIVSYLSVSFLYVSYIYPLSLRGAGAGCTAEQVEELPRSVLHDVARL